MTKHNPDFMATAIKEMQMELPKKPRYKWKPLQRVACKPVSNDLLKDYEKLLGLPREEALAALQREQESTVLWANDIYQVAVRVLDRETCLVHLNIRRRDGGAILRDWRHFQQIKNELLGPECEAVELYPAESRKVDASNKYHLIGVADPAYRFPFGDIFGNKRDVSYDSGSSPGTRQRPL